MKTGRLPHSHCNWVIKGLMIGAAPTPDTLPSLPILFRV